MEVDTGADLHRWAQDLFPIPRSLTGNGVRRTLHYLADLIPGLQIHEVPSGTVAMDWVVPDEWNVIDAYVAGPNGERLIDFQKSNLHLVGYSEPVDLILTRDQLDERLYSLPNLPEAIPYVTSYYRRTWGFCISENHRAFLGEGPFRAVVDSTLKPGNLTYGELIIPGDSLDEVLLTTYVCHPGMANNELSGPVVATALARWLTLLPRRHYTYKVTFLPETIGSLVYLSRHMQNLSRNLKAGWVLTCIGDEGAYSYLPSRKGDTLPDRVSLQALDELGIEAVRYSFLDRGSDERQFCAPRVNLPVVSLMRSKYGTYDEYHTSLDDLSFVTPKGLQGGLDLMKHVIHVLENNRTWRSTTYGEPHMSKHGLYPTTSTRESGMSVRPLMNVLAHCDGETDTLSIASIMGISVAEVASLSERLAEAGLVELVDHLTSPREFLGE